MEEKSNAFTVMPMNQQISLDPGQVYEGSIKIVNPSEATHDFAYKVEVTPYGVIDEDYKADLLTQSDYTAITKWIKIEEPTGTVAPNGTKDIKFTITVPENAPAGGQYATITVASDAEANNSEGVAIQDIYEMASIIYADINGETIHDGEILSNEVPSFAVSTPFETNAIVTNNGNIHEIANYSITVSDFFTGNIISTIPEEGGQYSEVIMPETTHYINREIDNLPVLGIVKINQTINYNGQTSITERDVVICPIWFIVLCGLAIAAIITTIIHLVRRHRRKKHAVI